MRRKHLKIPGEENKYTNTPSILKDQTFGSRPSLFNKEEAFNIITVP